MKKGDDVVGSSRDVAFKLCGDFRRLVEVLGLRNEDQAQALERLWNLDRRWRYPAVEIGNAIRCCEEWRDAVVEAGGGVSGGGVSGDDGVTPCRYRWEVDGVMVDFYRLMEAFREWAGVSRPAQEHAMKKIIRAGQGEKSVVQDIDEACASCLRLWEMMKEDGAWAGPDRGGEEAQERT